ncbi:MAG: sel1 repeat family protein, partial [Bacteroidetes bacterium]|nr:sel1 repeat family protein [Bacteroidota bacterium]
MNIRFLFLIVFQLVFLSYNTAQDFFSSIKKSAEQGDAHDQYVLGNMYFIGEGVLPNKKQAFYWYKKSAEQGNALAQFSLGAMYDTG